jgi:hypothetical protein
MFVYSGFSVSNSCVQINVITFFAAGAVVGATVAAAVVGAVVGCTTGGASVVTVVAVGAVAQAENRKVAIIKNVNTICLRCILFSSEIMLKELFYRNLRAISTKPTN